MDLPGSVKRLPVRYREMWVAKYDSALLSGETLDVARQKAWQAVRRFTREKKAMPTDKSLDIGVLLDTVETAFSAQYPDLAAYVVKVFDDHVITVEYPDMYSTPYFWKIPYTVSRSVIEGDPNQQEKITDVEFADRDSWLRVIPTFTEFKVIKSEDGPDRWLMVSSGMFEDRDGQIVTSELLEYAVKASDDDGNRGPLLLFHTWGTEVGTCDFQCVTPSGFLVESGTFAETPRGKAAAEYVEEHSPETGVSIQFVYSKMEGNAFLPPGRILERSLLPKNLAAFPWSGVSVKEVSQMAKSLDEAKLKFFEDVLGAEGASELLEELDAAGTLLKTAGVKFKEVDTLPEPLAEESEPEPTAEGTTTEPADEKSVDTTAPVIPNELVLQLDDAALDAIAERVVSKLPAQTVPAGLDTIEAMLSEIRAAFGTLAEIKSSVTQLCESDADKVARAVSMLPRAAVKVATPNEGVLTRPTQRSATAPTGTPTRPMADQIVDALK